MPVVIKVRALAGEGQTHAERVDYAILLRDEFDRVPPNLEIKAGPISDHLRAASALVTVSSTAAIEAIALGIPTLIVDDFGVSRELINEVFVGSGLLGSTAAMLSRDFRQPKPEWLADNYFHDESSTTWVASIERLVADNRRGLLEPVPRVIRGRGGVLRRAWDRRRALGSADRSLLGLVALAVGIPLRITVLGLHALARVLGPSPLALSHEAAEVRDGRRTVDGSR